MRKPDPLHLRGAMSVLDNAIRHIGRRQPVNEWEGVYRDPAVETAHGILVKALWHVEREFEKC